MEVSASSIEQSDVSLSVLPSSLHAAVSSLFTLSVAHFTSQALARDRCGKWFITEKPIDWIRGIEMSPSLINVGAQWSIFSLLPIYMRK